MRMGGVRWFVAGGGGGPASGWAAGGGNSQSLSLPAALKWSSDGVRARRGSDEAVMRQ